MCDHSIVKTVNKRVNLSFAFGRILTKHKYAVKMCAICGIIEHDLTDEEINIELRNAVYELSLGRTKPWSMEYMSMLMKSVYLPQPKVLS